MLEAIYEVSGLASAAFCLLFVYLHHCERKRADHAEATLNRMIERLADSYKRGKEAK